MPRLTRNMRSALLRGEYMKVCADMERTGVPLDAVMLRKLQANWDEVRTRLAGDAVTRYNIFDRLHLSYKKFEQFLITEGLDRSWPRTAKSKARQLNKETWKAMCLLNPDLEPLRQLYQTLRMPKLNIACDHDGRNRVLVGAFSTLTSRNAPGSDERGTFIFAPSRWVRFLIQPPEGTALAYLDWSSHEYGIGAVLSGDTNMLHSYEAGDPYAAFAKLAGAIPTDATPANFSDFAKVRKLYKSATLAIGYGQTPQGFNSKTKVGMTVTKRVFSDYYRTYAKYIAWRERQVDNFGISLRLPTKLGWTLQHGKAVKPNTALSFASQATGAEMLRLAIIEMRRRGLDVCCPVHDAVLIQSPIGEIERSVVEARAAMDDASALLLDGYVLRSEYDVFRHPERFCDEDGRNTWDKIVAIVNELSSDTANATGN